MREALRHPYFTATMESSPESDSQSIVVRPLAVEGSLELDSQMFLDVSVQTLLVATCATSNTSRHLALGAASWYSKGGRTSQLSMLQSAVGLESIADGDASPSVPALQGVVSPLSDTDNITFWCPKCGQSFKGDWNSCDKHLLSRKHGSRCIYTSSDLAYTQEVSPKALRKGIESSIERCSLIIKMAMMFLCVRFSHYTCQERGVPSSMRV